jgi:ribose transport system permease protein
MTQSTIQSRLRNLQSLLALAVMVAAMSILAPRFLTMDNGWNILRQISVNLCLSLGMTLVVLTAGIDLSVGAVLALCGAVSASLLKNGIHIRGTDLRIVFTVSGAITAGIATGFVAGVFNGILVTRFMLPAFVATLGTLSIARGLTMLLTRGFPVEGLGTNFGFLGTGWVLGIPMPVWLSVFLVIAMVILTRKLTFGRRVYAVGGNERAALLSGVNVDGIKLAVYALAGAFAGVAGLLVTARLDSAQPNAGIGYELDSIAAVVIGGVSLSGGRGSVLGTVIGCLIIGVLNNGLFLLDVSPFWQQVVKGCVIILAVAMDRRRPGTGG